MANFIFVTGARDALRASDDRRYAVIQTEQRVTRVNIVSPVAFMVVKPPARKGPTKNRKWWEK